MMDQAKLFLRANFPKRYTIDSQDDYGCRFIIINESKTGQKFRLYFTEGIILSRDQAISEFYNNTV